LKKQDKLKKRKRKITKESDYIDVSSGKSSKMESDDGSSEYYFLDGKKINDFLENSYKESKKKGKKQKKDSHSLQVSESASRLLNKVATTKLRLVHENKILKKDLTKSSADNKQLKNENTDLKKELAEVIKVCQKYNEKNQELGKVVQKLRDELKAQKIDNLKLDKKLKTKTEITNDIKAKYEDLKKKLGKIIC